MKTGLINKEGINKGNERIKGKIIKEKNDEGENWGFLNQVLNLPNGGNSCPSVGLFSVVAPYSFNTSKSSFCATG